MRKINTERYIYVREKSASFFLRYCTIRGGSINYAKSKIALCYNSEWLEAVNYCHKQKYICFL